MNNRTQIQVHFDGGYVGGSGYGSWDVDALGQIISRNRRVRFHPFAGYSSSNVSEYLALIQALQAIQDARDFFVSFNDLEVTIFSDSKLVVEQVNLRWKCHKKHLEELRNIVLRMLKPMGHWRIKWQSRTHNVARFGH